MQKNDKNNNNEGLLMDIRGLAKFLGISVESAKWMAQRQPTFPVVVIGKRRYYVKEKVLEWVEEHSTIRYALQRAKPKEETQIGNGPLDLELDVNSRGEQREKEKKLAKLMAHMRVAGNENISFTASERLKMLLEGVDEYFRK